MDFIYNSSVIALENISKPENNEDNVYCSAHLNEEEEALSYR